MSGSSGARCAESGNTELHARLLGTRVVDQNDLAPSASLSVVFFLLFFGLCYRYFRWRVTVLIPAAVAALSLALAFAIRVGIANSDSSSLARGPTQAEQILLSSSQLLLLYAIVDLSKSFVQRAALTARPARVAYATIVVCVLCFILNVIAFTKEAPEPIDTEAPPRRYTDMRVAAATISFIWILGYSLWLPFERAMHPLLSWRDLRPLVLFAWLAVVPAFYVFVTAVMTDDTSPIVCSMSWFYVAFGLFHALCVVPLLVLNFFDFGLDGARDLQLFKQGYSWEGEHEALRGAQARDDAVAQYALEQEEAARNAGRLHLGW